MKRLARRWVTLTLLIVGALLWVTLLSLSFGGSTRSKASDGATGRVTLIDKSAFPKVSSYLLLKDAAGQPIQGLQANNFSVTEDGIPVKVDFTSAGQQALTIILVIDHSGSMSEFDKMQGAQQAADTFIESMRPGRDSLGVIVFNDRATTLVPLAPLADDTAKHTAEAAVNQTSPANGTLLYDALGDAIQQMQGTSGRRVIIALTDGISDNRRYSQRSITSLATKENIPMYTIGLGRDVRGRDLEQLAKDTGGEYAFAPDANALQTLYSRLAQALQNEYRFVYTSPTAQLDGTRRVLDITAKRSNGDLLTSSDYAVGGVLVLNRNPLLLLLLTGVLLGLVAAPSVVNRVRRSPGNEGNSTLPEPSIVEPRFPAAFPVSQEPLAMARPARVAERIGEPMAASRPVMPMAPAPASPPAPLMLAYTLPLQGERTTIGSAPTNSIALPGLAPQQAVIQRQGGQWVIAPVAGVTLVSFNGNPAAERPITSANALKQGSTVRLGQYVAVFEMGDQPGLTFQAALQQPTTVGSTGNGALPLPTTTLRPQQAHFGYEGGRWFVEDLSGGGTTVSFGGDPSQLRPMAKSALKRGSLLRLGNLLLRVVE
ncbi:MAG: VWA domain-containing protein [Herpetosiphonaceae bacterium]|nr:VWA domain-containing protein [Herpetosiphonaceae bacterium]